jgi:AcrR family transcriptional regulator
MSTTAKPLRADAERNRRLLLDAASELFAERGLQVPLDDIAKRAGVGVGTAYRRFSSRSELIEALFDERLEQMVTLAEECLEIEDPWDALVSFIERSTELQSSDRGLKEVILGSNEGREKLGEIRQRMRPLGGQMIQRAKDSGDLREDFEAQDLPMLQIMLGGIADASAETEPDLWRRYLSLLLMGMRAEEKLAGPPPPSWDRLDGVLRCWRPPRRD